MPPAGTITYPYQRGKDVWGHSAVVPIQYTGPTAYATGGDVAFVAGLMKLGSIEVLLGGLAIDAAAGAGVHAVVFVYNPSSSVAGNVPALQAYWCAGAGAALVEVTNGTDLSGYTATILAMGKG